MPIPLTNPYDPTGKSWRQLHKVTGYVSRSDFEFFKNLLPAEGTNNAVIASLFKNFIDELRELNATTPLERAWIVDSPTYLVAQRILQRRAPRLSAGQESPRDDANGTSSVHPALRDPAEQRTEPKSRAKVGRRSSKKPKGESGEKGLSDAGNGVAD